MAKSRRGGPSTKAPGGLTEVLFIRIRGDLLTELDVLVERMRARHQGRVISRSDLVRELLYRAVTEERTRFDQASRTKELL